MVRKAAAHSDISADAPHAASIDDMQVNTNEALADSPSAALSAFGRIAAHGPFAADGPVRSLCLLLPSFTSAASASTAASLAASENENKNSNSAGLGQALAAAAPLLEARSVKSLKWRPATDMLAKSAQAVLDDAAISSIVSSGSAQNSLHDLNAISVSELSDLLHICARLDDRDGIHKPSAETSCDGQMRTRAASITPPQADKIVSKWIAEATPLRKPSNRKKQTQKTIPLQADSVPTPARTPPSTSSVPSLAKTSPPLAQWPRIEVVVESPETIAAKKALRRTSNALHASAVEKATKSVISVLETLEDDSNSDALAPARLTRLLRTIAHILPRHFTDLVAKIGSDREGVPVDYDEDLPATVITSGENALLNVVSSAAEMSYHAQSIGLLQTAKKSSKADEVPDASESSSISLVWSSLASDPNPPNNIAKIEQAVSEHLAQLCTALESARLVLLVAASDVLSTVQPTSTQSHVHSLSARNTSKFCSEGALIQCVELLRTQINATILNVMTISNTIDDKPETQAQHAIIASSEIRKRLSQLTSHILVCLDHLTTIANHVLLSDQVVITLLYLLLPLFFTEPSSMDTDLGFNPLLVQAMRLVAVLFSRYPTNRQFILEEIVTSFSRLAVSNGGSSHKRSQRRFHVSDDQSVSMVTALVIRLVQSCCVDIDAVLVNRKTNLVSDSNDDDQNGRQDDQSKRVQIVQQSVTQCKESIDTASACAAMMIKYLVSRCSTSQDSTEVALKSDGRRRTGTTESEFRSALEGFLNELLSLVDAPEWPAAEIVALCVTHVMVQTIDDTTARHGDVTAIRALALDWLGSFSAKATKLVLGYTAFASSAGISAIPAQGMIQTDVTGLVRMQNKVIKWLRDRQRQDEVGLDGCIGFSVAKWVSSYPFELKQDAPVTKKPTKSKKRSKDTDDSDQQQLIVGDFIAESYFTSVSHVSQKTSDGDMDVDEPDPLTAVPRKEVVAIAGNLMVTQTLVSTRDAVMQCIFQCLSSDMSSLRTHALKALQEIFTVDTSLLMLPIARRSVIERLHDISANVRDAAVDVLGRYMLMSGTDMFGDIYRVLKDRILDSSVTVRKRMLRLFRDAYTVLLSVKFGELDVDKQNMVIDMSLHMLDRVGDEPSVSDLSLKILGDLWLQPSKEEMETSHGDDGASVITSSKANGKLHAYVASSDVNDWQNLSESQRVATRSRIDVLSRVVSRSSAASAMFSDFLIRSVKQATKTSVPILILHVTRMVQCLMEQLLGLYDQSRFGEIADRLGLLLHLSAIAPEIVSPHMFALHPFIRPSATKSSDTNASGVAQQELTIQQHVLAIFRNVLPEVKTADPVVVADIEMDLMKLFNQKSQTVLESAVPCVCAIVKDHTHNSAQLARIVSSCMNYLSKVRKGYEGGRLLPASSLSSLWQSIILLSLVLRYYDFTTDRDANGVYRNPMLHAATGGTGSIEDCAYNMILFFFNSELSTADTVLCALLCIGNLATSRPLLFLRDGILNAFRRVFDSTNVKAKKLVLKILFEYLEREKVSKTDQRVVLNASVGSEPVSAPKSRKRKSDPSSTTTNSDKPNTSSSLVDIKILTGTSDTFAESGVSSAISQRFMDDIIACMLSPDVSLSQLALQVVTVIVDHGLVHPILAVPGICALSTSDIPKLSLHAFGVYQKLVAKHASFVHTRNVDAVWCVYEYHRQCMMHDRSNQQDVTQPTGCVVDRVLGYTTTTKQVDAETWIVHESRLCKLYRLIRVSRARRNEFLLGMIRLFESEPQKLDQTLRSLTQPDTNKMCDKNPGFVTVIEFLLFVADNVLFMEFKNQEEVMLIGHAVNRILSVAGETVFDIIRATNGSSKVVEKMEYVDAKSLAAQAFAMGMLALVKARLQFMYQISDARMEAFVPSGTAAARNAERPVMHPPGSAASVAAEHGVLGVIADPIDWQKHLFAPVDERETKSDLISYLDRLDADGLLKQMRYVVAMVDAVASATHRYGDVAVFGTDLNAAATPASARGRGGRGRGRGRGRRQSVSAASGRTPSPRTENDSDKKDGRSVRGRNGRIQKRPESVRGRKRSKRSYEEEDSESDSQNEFESDGNSETDSSQDGVVDDSEDDQGLFE